MFKYTYYQKLYYREDNSEVQILEVYEYHYSKYGELTYLIHHFNSDKKFNVYEHNLTENPDFIEGAKFRVGDELFLFGVKINPKVKIIDIYPCPNKSDEFIYLCERENYDEPQERYSYDLSFDSKRSIQ